MTTANPPARCSARGKARGRAASLPPSDNISRDVTVACMAHIRRKVFDVQAARDSAVAAGAPQRIAALYAVEQDARGLPADRRSEIRRADAAALFDDVVIWLKAQLPKISGEGPLAAAIRYALSRLPRLRPYREHGILEIDNNICERSFRGVALGKENWLFAGSEGGGRAGAIAYTLIETAKLNGVDPQAWLTVSAQAGPFRPVPDVSRA